MPARVLGVKRDRDRTYALALVLTLMASLCVAPCTQAHPGRHCADARVNVSCVGASDLGRQPLAAAWPVNRTRTAKNRPLNHLLTEPNRTWLGSVRTHSTDTRLRFQSICYTTITIVTTLADCWLSPMPGQRSTHSLVLRETHHSCGWPLTVKERSGQATLFGGRPGNAMHVVPSDCWAALSVEAC
jgi:hypothetical protein